MDHCPDSPGHGKHAWRGERLIGTWFWMCCKWCGATVLHDVSGKVNRGA